ncbi:MAG TPA: acetate/propionate family kinase [Candidatus Binatia bacterium]|nr:acetate/propionate family kinase [Candidatus Binatia bacterium]
MTIGAAGKIPSTSETRAPCVLAINGGSSSIKFALYTADSDMTLLFSGKIDRIASPEATLTFQQAGKEAQTESVDAPDHGAAAAALMDRLEQRLHAHSLHAAGHRIVHGGPGHRAPERVTAQLIDDLRRLETYDPEHLPSEIRLLEALGERYPDLPQVACFDTAFHDSLPRIARLLPIPRRFEAKGVRRYGFHGLSYAYLMEELARVDGSEAANGRVILAHLGNGASLAAVRGGKCIDTTMGFTPAAGLPMSTRAGDLDPGLVGYMAREERITAERFHEMVNRESGLLGISEISSDMRTLLARESTDVRAAEAVALFCYQTRKWIGAFSAALNGLDTLVFAGGIGENSPIIRDRICAGLGFLGVGLDETKNQTGAPVISRAGSPVTVRVIHTDEEVMIARAVCRLLGLAAKKR